MALALTVLNAPNGTDNSQKRTCVEGTGVLSGNYAAGGEAINWLALQDASGQKVLLNTSNLSPLWVEFQIGVPDGAVWPLVYNYSTGKLQSFVQSTGDEQSAGAYAGSQTGATLYFKAEFQND
ncbi:MAG: hypothetical protein ACLGXA_24415 [Acidobacteriota bacterium]